MANLEIINLRTGQTPTEADWEYWLNRTALYINNGIPVSDILKNASGKLEVDIEGDATTVGGMTPEEIIGGDFPDVKQTLIDFITGGDGLVLSGGVATKNDTTANQLDITACVAIQKVTTTGYINRVELAAGTKTTTLANQTYYLDIQPSAADFSWGTSHPDGDYVTLATVTTDESANISTVLDTRPLFAQILKDMDALVLAENFVVGDVDQTSAPTGNITKEGKHSIKQAFSWFANILKSITGKLNWWEKPDVTLEDAKTHINNTENPHGVTAEQVGASPVGHITDTSNPHNVTAEQIGASNILTELKTVDGAGSGLDADKLQGNAPKDIYGHMIGIGNVTILSDYTTEEYVNYQGGVVGIYMTVIPTRHRITIQTRSPDGATASTVRVYVGDGGYSGAGSPVIAKASTFSSLYTTLTLDLPYPIVGKWYITVSGGDADVYARNVYIKAYESCGTGHVSKVTSVQ